MPVTQSFLQSLIWGGKYRHITDALSNHFSPLSENTQLISTFFQADLKYFDGFLIINAGTKVEHNDYTGFELQPSLRALLDISPEHKLWAAISKAVRTPSRASSSLDLDVTLAPGLTTNISGSDHVVSEELTAYEVGYRFLPSDKVKLEFAAYYNDYDQIETGDALPIMFGGAGAVVPVNIDNNAIVDSYGFEANVKWQVREWWRIQSSYTWSNFSIGYTGTSDDYTILYGVSPEHQLGLHSFLNLPFNTELDIHWYYVDQEKNNDIDAYHRFDIRLGWQPTKNIEVSLTGRNLFDPEHLESCAEDNGVFASQIERSIYAQVNLRF
jgi:iron complex outermembrane receptor protein